MRRSASFILTTFLAMTGIASADDCCPKGARNAPCDTCFEYKDKTCVLPSARLCQRPCDPTTWGGRFDVAILAWQAREDGLDFAVKNNPFLTPSATLTQTNGTLIGPRFEWMPAVKVDLGLDMPRSWDLNSRWTFYYNRSSHSAHTTSVLATGSGLLPLWLLPQGYAATPNVYNKARAIWNLHYNAIDLELGYDPKLTKHVSLRIHGGLKGVSILQRFRVKYSEGINTGTEILLPSRAALKSRNYALGPRIGFDSKWRLKKGWSLIADGAGSLTLGETSIRRRDSDNAINTAGTLVTAISSTYHESIWVYRPIVELRAGFGWNDCFGCRKNYAFGFEILYEIQYFWEQNMMRLLGSNPISFTAFSARGDLQLHGATVNFHFGF